MLKVVKAPETKKENQVSQVQKGNLYNPVSSSVEQILFLQRTIGNQAVQRLMRSRTLQAKMFSESNSELSTGLEAKINEVKTGGQPLPDTVQGKELLAHELTHVVQQNHGIISRKVSADYGKIKEKLSYGLTDWAITEDETREVLKILASLNPTDLEDTMKKMETDGIVGDFLDNISDTDRMIYKSLFVSLWQSHVPPHSSLADQADILGNETITMNSYRDYQDKSRRWFFSPNNTLEGRAGKPVKFDTWDDWNKMHWQSKQVIADLAGLDASGLSQTNSNLTSLKAAYATWPATKYAVFQSGTSDTNTCNIFLGDTIYMNGQNQTKSGKYYSAEEVYDGTGSFTAIHADALSRGDIAAWGGHVEVVTSVNLAKNEFCSRGGYREPMGGEKCGGANRQINYSNLRFFRIK
jgi:hypothetical protein